MIGQDLFALLAAQVWQVALLAVLAWIAVKLCAADRPHLAHAIWALVLLKCVFPPVLSSPFSPFSWMASPSSQNLPATNPLPVSAFEDPKTVLQSPIVTSQRLTQSRLSVGNSIAAQVSPTLSPVNSSSLRVPIDLANATPTTKIAPSTGESSAGVAPVTEHQPKNFWPAVVVWVWLAGAAIGLAVMGIRFALFVAWLRKGSAAPVGEVETIVENLRQRLKIRSAIGIKVSERPVGPAVIGLFRPTILLPAALIENKTNAEIEPLIAHELIHVRRGDLWWAMLQTVATCLFWFHPFVLVASKMLTVESERSCDEETIAGLGCRPADYARGLLQVLEQKQQLRVAPALPGVRPVDVTTARLERVMKLGNGIRSRTPSWVWLVMLVCGAIVLPGATWAANQEEATPGGQVKVGETTNFAASPVLPESKQDDLYQEHRFEVGDLLRQIRERSVVEHSAESILINALSICEPPADSEQQLGIGCRFTRPRGAQISGNQLIAKETPKRIKIIQEFIDNYREHGFDQVVAETNFLRINQEQLNKLGIEWQQVKSEALANAGPTVVKDDSGKQPSVGIPTLNLPNRAGIHAVTHIERGTPVLFSVVSEMDQQRIRKKIENGETGKSARTLHRSNVTMFNGRDAEVSVVSQRPFVTAVDEVLAAEGGGKGHQPVISLFETGARMRIRPVIKGNTIEVDCHLQLKEISDVKVLQLSQRESKESETVFHALDEKGAVQVWSSNPEGSGERIVPPTGMLVGGGNTGVSIQSPTVIATNIEVKRSMKLGETLLLEIPSNDRASETDTLFVMLTCRKITCEWAVESELEKKQVAERAAAIAAAKKLPIVVQDNQVEDDVFVIKAGDGDQASDVKPREFEVMGMKFRLEGKIKFEVNDSAIEISGKQLSVSFDGGDFVGSCEDEGTIEFDIDETGEVIGYKIRFAGRARIQILESFDWIADSILFSVNDESLKGTLEGNARLQYEGFTGLADRVTFDDSGMVTLSGRASLFRSLDDKPNISVRGEKILISGGDEIDGEPKITVNPDDHSTGAKEIQ